jgi:hypothetical protein
MAESRWGRRGEGRRAEKTAVGRDRIAPGTLGSFIKILRFEGTAFTLKGSTLPRFAFTLGQFIEFQIDRRFLAGVVVAK